MLHWDNIIDEITARITKKRVNDLKAHHLKRKNKRVIHSGLIFQGQVFILIKRLIPTN